VENDSSPTQQQLKLGRKITPSNLLRLHLYPGKSMLAHPEMASAFLAGFGVLLNSI
jgi:hypothetical protein